jgi:hypothetical protein
MKKLILVMAVLMGLMTACEMEYGTAEEIEIGNVYDYDFENDIDFITNTDNKESTINSINIFREFVAFDSTYVSDIDLYHVKDHWALPETFYNNGMRGDCEDYAGFLGYLLYVNFNLNCDIVFITTEYTNILHALVYIEPMEIYVNPLDNSYYDEGKLIQSLIYYKMKYTQYIYKAKYFPTKNII